MDLDTRIGDLFTKITEIIGRGKEDAYYTR